MSELLSGQAPDMPLRASGRSMIRDPIRGETNVIFSRSDVDAQVLQR